MNLTSPVFQDNAALPERYACDGDSVNPPLTISAIPATAKSLVLIMDDIDAQNGSFIHWIVFDIPIISYIDEDSIPGKQAVSSAKRKNYAGPCPPEGRHRYVFTVYALDRILSLPEGSSKDEIMNAMQPAIIDKASLTGTYQKKVMSFI
jgi:Raf kinase inhibitor-like YbhB/YbcL family protein